jgi:hypothetical protein
MDATGLIDNAPPNFSLDLKSYIYAYSVSPPTSTFSTV